jgi:DNA-directed RNA polymerase specialized sigma24 family protein
MTSSAANSSQAPSQDYFAKTRWTVVLAAGRKSSPQSDQALAELCQVYWYPLYTYVRRLGHSREDSEDLVQSFFARFLEKNYLEGLHSERGRFRAFLLACLKHFLANEADKAGRQKRGGGLKHVSLDWQDADSRYHLEPPDYASPDRAFDRSWALALLERVIGRLREECLAQGKGQLFEKTKGCLMMGESVIPYAQAAQALALEEGAVRVAVHRLRQRYRRLLRDEIAQTLADPDQVTEELKVLQAVLAA